MCEKEGEKTELGTGPGIIYNSDSGSNNELADG